MPRPGYRATLECGLKLDINSLARRGFIDPGGYRIRGIRWTDSYSGELTASGIISADMSGPNEGWFRIQIGRLDQRIDLVARPRHLGGRQWYFVCPYLNRCASVLWMPPGARSFRCRQGWGRQVAYASQFLGPADRAHHGQARIKAKLCRQGGFNPDEWDLPPKPKWMRLRTYNRAAEKFDRYEAALDEGLIKLAAKFGIRI